ncbi:MAG TPA: mevalonate kinase [Patescibacteria group bacterium]
MNIIKVSAPGKLHLLGEHTVIYGKPALLAAVNRRCLVKIAPRKDKMVEIVLNDFKWKTSEKKILAKTKQAEKIWKTFSKTNNISILKKIVGNPLDYSLLVIGKTLDYYQKSFASGFTLMIDSAIPFGVGMGSSAASAVAIAGAVSLFLGEKLDTEKINIIAFQVEHFVHGFPSGGDTSIACFGGFVWFRRETSDLKFIQPLQQIIPDKLANNFYIINTGEPRESTGEMVAMVKKFVEKQDLLSEKIFTDQERLTRQLLSAIENNNEEDIKNIIKNGERNLEKLGVVSISTKKIIREIEKAGGAAKICGGGGKAKATGMLLVYHAKQKIIEALVKEKKLLCDTVLLGDEGIRIER